MDPGCDCVIQTIELDDPTFLEGDEVVPNKVFTSGVTVTKPGYYTVPRVIQLEKYMREDGSCLVPNFVIGHVRHGCLVFPGVTNVVGMNLDLIINIGHKSVEIYPNDIGKPSIGEGLNKLCIVTLYKVWPKNSDRISSFHTMLKTSCQRFGGTFLRYDDKNGEWCFRVQEGSQDNFEMMEVDEEEIILDYDAKDNKAHSMASRQKLTLRIKSKKSQNAVLKDVDPKESVQSLLEKLSQLTDIPVINIALMKGFPLKRMSYERTNLVESLGLQNHDTLFVDLVVAPSSTSRDDPNPQIMDDHHSPASDNRETASVSLVPDPPSGLLLRQTVPSDNSCLFTSITFCLSGKLPAASGASFLREMIGNTVAGDPVRFTVAILGRPNAEYVKWIRKPESWGGGIEIAILSDVYRMKISVVDIQSLQISNFGENHDYAQRVFIIYDGIHFDPLYFEPFNGGPRRTMFEASDQRMMDLAMQLGREASNQFPDLQELLASLPDL